MMHRVYPLQDVRWEELVAHHPRATVFHTAGWLQALHRTYGYEPVAFSTSATDQPLGDAIVFCDINSWITGRRLVSLPFSDHCDPLVEQDRMPEVLADLEREWRARSWRYLEIRPQGRAIGSGESGFAASTEFVLHRLDLQPTEDQLFKAFHRTATQQVIRRAEREGLTQEAGRSERLLRSFYSLLALTRRRHRMPPQPFTWFCNLARIFGDAMCVRIASAGDTPIAGIVTLRHRQTLTFKYGASDAAFHRLGGIQLLLWTAIRDARAAGCATLDLGRSDIEQTGLRTFKDRWGAASSRLIYWRLPRRRPLPDWIVRSVQAACGRVPAPLLATAGKYLYRHVA